MSESEPATVVLDNGSVRLDASVGAGPRVVGLRLAGSDENVFAEVPDLAFDTQWGEYRLLGGHRLWRAPEDAAWTAVPEVGPPDVRPRPSGVRLERLDEPTKLRRTIDVELAESGAEVRVAHAIRNEGDEPTTLAAWAITMLPLGGTAVLPQQVGARPGEERLPNRATVLWPYTSVSDPRLRFGDDLVLVSGEAGPELKLGQVNTRGWAAYVRKGVVFCKRFEPQVERPHADLGCNVEVYCNERFFELETLGPLEELAPGEEARHDELWQLRRVDDLAPSPDRIAALVSELGLP